MKALIESVQAYFIKKYKSSEQFRKDAIKEAYRMELDNTSAWKAHAHIACYDKQGRAYYSFRDESKVPNCRASVLMQIEQEIRDRLSFDDCWSFVENSNSLISACKVEVQNIKQNIGSSETVINAVNRWEGLLKDWGSILGLLKERREIEINPNLIMRMACIVLIREDENPFEVNDHIEEEKFETFMQEHKDGLGFFFQKHGLESYLNFSRQFISSVNAAMKDTKKILDNMNQRDRDISKALAATS